MYSKKNNYLKGVILCLLATMSWGIMYPVVANAINYIDPFTFTAIRYTITATIFLFIAIQKEGLKTLKATKKQHITAFILGSVGFAGFGLLVFWGQEISGKQGTLNASIIIGSTPLIGFILNTIIKRKMPKILTLIFILLSFLGVILVVTNGNNLEYIIKNTSYKGSILILLGAIGWVIYTMGANLFPKWSSYKYTNLTSLWSLVVIYSVNIILLATKNTNIPSITNIIIIIPHILYTSIIAGFISILAWNIGNKILTPVNGVLFMNFVPITTFIMSALFFNAPSNIQIIGASITAIMLTLNNLYQKRLIKKD